MRVGIIGCGLIGSRRADVVRQSPEGKLVIVADVDGKRAGSLAEKMGCNATTDWQVVVTRDDIEVIIVATPNKYHMPVTVAALENGKHVLCEKPPGRNINETHRMVTAAKHSGYILKIGFNHRHHPAIWKAHELSTQGAIGPLFFVRAVYGHGGRPGYEKEWRGDPDLSGGGELLDQGVHIVDLCRWFMGEFDHAFGSTSTYFWELGEFDSKIDKLSDHRKLEDNVFVVLMANDDRIAQWHTSWTQWKNRFSFEVFGRNGFLRVEGLGGSYGIESLTVGKRRSESDSPDEKYYEFPGPDTSWQLEWEEFVSAINEGREPIGSGEDGYHAMRLIDAIYESAHSNRIVSLSRSSCRNMITDE